jgi:tetratricopeptide (TPR) repeat protein
MKLVSAVLPALLFGLVLTGCAHQKPAPKPSLAALTPEQLEQLNREALVLASKRLEEMVAQARTNKSTQTYLASDLFLKGNMSLLEGDYATATVLFRHLTALVPDDQFVQKKFAISLIREGELEEARGVLEKLYAASKDERVGLILAGVYNGTDREADARTIYRKLLAANPKNEDACVFLGKSLAVAKETGAALRELKRCAKADRKNGMYDYYTGKIYVDQGQVPKAIAAFRSAFARQPDLGQAVAALGVILEERDQHEAAIKIYRRYLEKEAADTAILTRMVQVLFRKERFAEVIPYAERLADLEPENLNLKVKLGILYTDAKQYAEAISVFRDLLAAAPQSDKILYYLGAIHQELNQFQESIEYFNQIPASSGLYSDSSVQMANMLSSLAQAEHAARTPETWKPRFLAFVNDRLGQLPDLRVEFAVIKAGFYEGTGQYRAAMEAVMVVQDEKGFTTQHKYYLANLYEREKKYEESTALVRGILEKEPKNAHAWNFLGYSLLVRGQEIDRAYEYIQTALKLSPNDGYIRDSLGWYYYKKGEIRRALVELEVAHKKVPDDVEILKHLAVIHRELKDYGRSKAFLEAALKHVRYHVDRQEILGQIEELERDRIPASKIAE